MPKKVEGLKGRSGLMDRDLEREKLGFASVVASVNFADVIEHEKGVALPEGVPI